MKHFYAHIHFTIRFKYSFVLQKSKLTQLEGLFRNIANQMRTMIRFFVWQCQPLNLLRSIGLMRHHYLLSTPEWVLHIDRNPYCNCTSNVEERRRLKTFGIILLTYPFKTYEFHGTGILRSSMIQWNIKCSFENTFTGYLFTFYNMLVAGRGDGHRYDCGNEHKYGEFHFNDCCRSGSNTVFIQNYFTHIYLITCIICCVYTFLIDLRPFE